jgi:hypothetical protein
MIYHCEQERGSLNRERYQLRAGTPRWTLSVSGVLIALSFVNMYSVAPSKAVRESNGMLKMRTCSYQPIAFKLTQYTTV